MKLSTKIWYLNIFFSLIIILGTTLLFLDNKDSTSIIVTMIGIPLGAMGSEMGLYTHAVAKKHLKELTK